MQITLLHALVGDNDLYLLVLSPVASILKLQSANVTSPLSMESTWALAHLSNTASRALEAVTLTITF